jgi:hypothetical protein
MMHSRVVLFWLFVSVIVVTVAVMLSQVTEANGNPIHHRLETKSALAGWGTCPDEEATPNVVCISTFIQVSESSTQQGDQSSIGRTLSFIQNQYSYDGGGNLVPISNSHGFTNDLAFEQDADLNHASMTAVVPVQTCAPDASGNQVCQPAVDTEVSVSWSADGRLMRAASREERPAGQWLQVIDSRNYTRSAAATGQAGEHQLGDSLYGTLLRAQTETTWSCVGRCP